MDATIQGLGYRVRGLGFRDSCRPMVNKPAPFRGLNIRIPIIVPIEGRGGYKSGVFVTRKLVVLPKSFIPRFRRCSFAAQRSPFPEQVIPWHKPLLIKARVQDPLYCH